MGVVWSWLRRVVMMILVSHHGLQPLNHPTPLLAVCLSGRGGDGVRVGDDGADGRGQGGGRDQRQGRDGTAEAHGQGRGHHQEELEGLLRRAPGG